MKISSFNVQNKIIYGLSFQKKDDKKTDNTLISENSDTDTFEKEDFVLPPYVTKEDLIRTKATIEMELKAGHIPPFKDKFSKSELIKARLISLSDFRRKYGEFIP